MPLRLGQNTTTTAPPAGYSELDTLADGELYFISDLVPEIQITNQQVSVTGARDDPESALANLLTVLEGLGFIVDNTTST
jgi:enamine deaminase RidA (YjgF/YER057c/UK114 family)